MKSLKWLLIVSLAAVPLIGKPGSLSAEGSMGNELILKKNSREMVYNGTQVMAAQALTLKNGSAYAALNGIAQTFGYAISYDVKSREAIAKSRTTELRFKVGSDMIKVNGTSVKGPGPTFALNGSLMIPIRMWSNLTGSTILVSGLDTVIKWGPELTADFSVLPVEIYANQTFVTYRVDSSVPYVDERWEGKQDVFTEPGLHVITRTVMDEHGNWSEPFRVTINVLQPNQAPVADFSTDKTVYRLGEPVQYTDVSTDDRNNISKRAWTGKEPVYFEPGDKTISLLVTDSEGLTSTISKTITVTDEVMYTPEEYGLLFTEPGYKYQMSGSTVLGYDTITYTFENEPAQMVRSNNPETLTEDGLVYDDFLVGKTRFLFHNFNSMDHNVKMYLVATNTNSMTAKVGVGAYGLGGPDPFVANTGKLSTARYLDAISRNPEQTLTSVRPGESVVILPELSTVPIKPQQAFSAYADVTTDKNVRFRVVFAPSTEDIASMLAPLDTTKMLPEDGTNVRGTFNKADRKIELAETVGLTPQRVVLGDGKLDTYLDGIDATTGRLQLNLGNFGVLYNMKVHAAPHTLIGLNARGGEYMGAFLMNGQLVKVTEDSILKTQNETAVLYRTGDSAEDVDIVFTLASGGNLPINLLFLPMPSLKS